jgi:serine/threonine-protein kinase
MRRRRSLADRAPCTTRNIAEVHTYGRASGRPFIAMELIDGPSLAAILRRRARAVRPIALATIAEIGVELCAALGYAHTLAGSDGVALGLVHRDVSPQNVLLERDGGLKLIDFGIARASTRTSHTRVGQIRGKLAYAAPEQLLGKPVHARADLFALGVLLYEALALERPFTGDSDSAIVSAVIDGRRRPVAEKRPGAGPLASVIELALATDPDARFASAAEFAGALRDAVGELPGPSALRELVRETESLPEVTLPTEATTATSPRTEPATLAARPA